MKAQYNYESPFGSYLLTVTGKSAARGMDSLRNARKALAAANDRISEGRRARKHLTQLWRKERAEVERLKAELAAMQAESDERQATAERCFKTAMKNAVIIDSLKLSLEAERRDNRLLRRKVQNAGLPSIEEDAARLAWFESQQRLADERKGETGA